MTIATRNAMILLALAFSVVALLTALGAHARLDRDRDCICEYRERP